jgi:hypothetical protein
MNNQEWVAKFNDCIAKLFENDAEWFNRVCGINSQKDVSESLWPFSKPLRETQDCVNPSQLVS